MNNAANLKAFRLRQSFERSRTFPRSGAAAGREDMRVGIIGIGMTAFRPSTPEYNWKELMFEAASRAYADAAIDPREDVDSFITCAEDYYEGFGIFDEFVPDQLGAALRPTCTVSGDGLPRPAPSTSRIARTVASSSSWRRIAPRRSSIRTRSGSAALGGAATPRASRRGIGPGRLTPGSRPTLRTAWRNSADRPPTSTLRRWTTDSRTRSFNISNPSRSRKKARRGRRFSEVTTMRMAASR